MNKSPAILSVVAACALFATFALNVYIALYDSTLAQENVVHYELNIVIAAITFAAALALLVERRSLPGRIAAGIIWPILYLGSLAFDVQTELCFGTGIHCWPSVADSYKYLILNEAVEGWVLSPYTMRTMIGLLIAAVFLSAVSVSFSLAASRSSKAEEERPTTLERTRDGTQGKGV